MFDSLSSKLQNAFRNLRGLGKISEENAGEALREVRLALLEADVNFKVARDFIERVKAKSIGQEVGQSIQPGHQVIKIIHDELGELLGSANAGLQLSGNPSCVLMVGLHGSGKTTSSGKLGRLLLKQGRTPLLVAADVYRPAAMDQLEKLGQQLELPVFLRKGESDVLKIARQALDFARANNRNTLIFDTAGRLQIDEPLIQELVRLRDLVKANETMLSLAAATRQDEARRMEEKMRKGQFTLEDFLDQLRQMKKLGSLESIVSMLPGGAEAIKGADLTKQEKEFSHMEAMICGMTPQERRNPHLLNAKRRQRIAKGSGVSVTELNTMLNKFAQMQQMMKKMGKFQKMMARMSGGG